MQEQMNENEESKELNNELQPNSMEEQTTNKEIVENTLQEETEQESVLENTKNDQEDSNINLSKEDLIEDEVFDLENFNWDDYSDNKLYNSSEYVEMSKKYDDNIQKITVMKLIKGVIRKITKREFTLDIDYKSDAIVSANEFKYNEDLKEGDEIDLYVEEIENKQGMLSVSHKKARTLIAWNKLNELLESGEITVGYIKSKTKGGMIVDLFGLDTFLPGSQIDVRPIKDYDIYVGKRMEFKVVKINHEFKNVVVSHRALIEAEIEEQKSKIISGLEIGQVLQGIVKNVTPYGAFIDLGGIDGLVHITDLSWKRVKDPNELLKVEDKINVVILGFDEEKKRVALGMKQLLEHPWNALDENIKEGDTIKGKILVINDYGAFVEILDGVEGLLHISEMSWSQYLRSASDYVTIGQEIECKVLSLDRDEKKMSLGLKQLTEDPWKSVVDKYPIESKHTCTVKNYNNYGVFVELEPGIDGIIHISDLTWKKKIKHPSEFCTIGDTLDVKILEIDQEKRRLSLGHKQIDDNPWDVLDSLFSVGSIQEGTVSTIDKRGGFIVELQYGIEGYMPAKYGVKEDETKLNVGETVQMKVIEFDKDNKKIILSHSSVYGDKIAEEKKKNSKRTSEAVDNNNLNNSKFTLGDNDILNEMLKNSKKTERDNN